MKKKNVLTGILILLVILTVAGTKVSQMRRTTSIATNDLIMLVRTVNGKKTNFAAEVRYLGIGTNGGGSGETNTLGDAANVGVSLVGAKVGPTNLVKTLSATGSGLTVTAQGDTNAQFALHSRLENQIGAPPPTNAQTFALQAGISNVVFMNPASNIVVGLSNLSATADVEVRFAAGNYPFNPSNIQSNGLGGINIFNKSGRVRLIGIPGQTIFDTRAGLGDSLWVTNCPKFEISGITFLGRVETNYTVVNAIYTWAALQYYNTPDIRITDCDFIDHHDHGIGDHSSQQGWITTSFAFIQNNRLRNIGSERTNLSFYGDGTAIVPTRGVVSGNYITDCWRGIEPYYDGGLASVPVGLTISGNTIINSVDDPITFSGNTNIHEVLIANNTIINTNGYARRGTNAAVTQQGIRINGGQRHIVSKNYVRGMRSVGIYVGGGYVDGVVVEDNDVAGSGSYDALIGNENSTVTPVTRLMFRNNKSLDPGSVGLYVISARDSTFEGNQWINPTDVSGNPAVLVGASGNNRSTNLIFRANRVNESAALADYGFSVASGNVGIKFELNTVSGTTAGDIENNAGSEVTVFNTTTGSTDKIARISDLSGVSGTNNPVTLSAGIVTLATNQTVAFTTNANADFSVIFAGAASNASTRAELTVSNRNSTTNISAVFTVPIYDPRVGSNVTRLAVSPLSQSIFPLKVNAVGGWELGAVGELYGQLAGGRGFGTITLLSTNGAVVTATVTATNGITYLPTNTTAVHVDWTGLEEVNIPTLLETNLVIIPTNMVIGRSVRLLLRSAHVNYNVSISNAAGTRILYPFASTNSGSAALTSTNGQQIEMDLLPRTNGIAVAFGRFQ